MVDSENTDFKHQLKLEELEKSGKLEKDTKSYRDSDGILYIWDDSKKAYFPKASYGVSQSNDGSYLYTDPISKQKLKYNSELKQWCIEGTDNLIPNINTSVTNMDKNMEFDFEKRCYIYRDPETHNVIYEWDTTANKWVIPKALNNTNKIDKKRKKIFSDPKIEDEEKKPEWFEMDDSKNTNVYVSNLPEDITLDEFTELMSKCGIIMQDPNTKQLKIKLYLDPDGNVKGDGRCCYLKVESVTLALQIIDGTILRDKCIKVERAKFTMKGDYNPELKPKKKKGTEKQTKESKQEKLLAWKPEPIPGLRHGREKTLVIKNVFDPKLFDDDPSLILKYQKELRDIFSKYGNVKKIKVYDRHPEGVTTVTFATIEEADECMDNLGENFSFKDRHVHFERWDGRTKYKIVETPEDEAKRLKNWEQFLEQSDEETDNIIEKNSV